VIALDPDVYTVLVETLLKEQEEAEAALAG